MSRARRKTRVGAVVSDSMDKTIVVSVERRFAHQLYGRQVTRHKRYFARDEEGQARVGDVVRIMETRPLSKKVRWRLDEIIRRSE